ncbi:Taurine transport system permease protein TauC [Vibrio astriarenae]|nr:Taurine transport system permease protein TauC [Vibrio sp. C7]
MNQAVIAQEQEFEPQEVTPSNGVKVSPEKQDSVVHKTPPFYLLIQGIKRRTLTPANYYGEPGQGDSRIISVIASIFFIALWALVTEMGWVKPLFLPTPSAVIERFGDLVVHGFSGVSLTEHLAASLGRVFGAFFLAVVTAVRSEFSLVRMSGCVVCLTL